MDSLLYFLAFAALFFVAMRFGCGAHVTGHSHGHGHDKQAGSAGDLRSVSSVRAATGQVTDVVCGMTVETARARSSVYEGNAYYFCGEECRKKFETNPAQFAARAVKEDAHEH
ncbi:MAG: YHS domain-containing protein [Alphaproteobacteria bacterium]|nr:YHS domain-containing protein [Alphaproteobacteria bacterium]